MVSASEFDEDSPLARVAALAVDGHAGVGDDRRPVQCSRLHDQRALCVGQPRRRRAELRLLGDDQPHGRHCAGASLRALVFRSLRRLPRLCRRHAALRRRRLDLRDERDALAVPAGAHRAGLHRRRDFAARPIAGAQGIPRTFPHLGRRHLGHIEHDALHDRRLRQRLVRGVPELALSVLHRHRHGPLRRGRRGRHALRPRLQSPHRALRLRGRRPAHGHRLRRADDLQHGQRLRLVRLAHSADRARRRRRRPSSLRDLGAGRAPSRARSAAFSLSQLRHRDLLLGLRLSRHSGDAVRLRGAVAAPQRLHLLAGGHGLSFDVRHRRAHGRDIARAQQDGRRAAAHLFRLHRPGRNLHLVRALRPARLVRPDRLAGVFLGLLHRLFLRAARQPRHAWARGRSAHSRSRRAGAAAHRVGRLWHRSARHRAVPPRALSSARSRRSSRRPAFRLARPLGTNHREARSRRRPACGDRPRARQSDASSSPGCSG